MKEYILSNKEAQAVDDYTMGELGYSGKELMKKAGGYVAMKAKNLLNHVPGSRIEIFCGTGNNGGDGFVAAGELSDWGAHVHVWIVGTEDKISGDALYYYNKIKDDNQSINFLKKAEDLENIQDLHGSDLIIDALLGTGLKGDVRGLYADLIDMINNSNRPVLSVDIPSGINGDTGLKGGKAVKAVKTITMGFLKRGLLYNDGPDYSGKVIVGDLKYPQESYDILDYETYLFKKEDLKKFLPKIAFDVYKHRMGKVLCYCGSPGMTGAAVLVSRAAQRSGAGLVISAIPASLNTIMEIKLTEGLSFPVKESEKHTFCKTSLESSREKIDWSNTIVFGPGVSDKKEVMDFGIELLNTAQKPFVIDADGLKIFKDNLDLIKKLDSPILTPHIGELSFITGESVDEIKENIIDFGRDFAQKYGCILVLKGPHTITFSPEGTATVNATGNPGLATGGTGDVLTGIIAALVAQGLDPFDATASAVSVHGAAADEAVNHLGFRGLIAGDLLKYIPEILKQYDELKH
ncbi:MAG: NAD(P)H-hydrate dehydratase [Candidatus Marinimicrobia bacterium]|nr:NAD(P)H-hydrate dehydratase [Candidatus Neomarinimicrobiota bacterium]